RASAAIVLAAAVVALGLGTRARSHVYASAVGLWQDTVEKRPEDARPRIAYGEALAAAGRFAEAEAELRKGTELAPQDAFALVRLGSVLAQQRKYDEAVSHLVTALAVSPGNFDAHRFLADIRALRGEDESAVEHYEAALATVPADARVLTALAAVLAGSRDPNVRNPARARGYAERAVAATGGQDARALQALSAAQAADGSLAEAARTARSAAAVARARGEIALADALEYRALSYESVRK
ncbi:MAG TPA: tetratricopeptide repeat protein, partial [Vicinamibacterales bacterium]|nr:tetratricopeptide repeat protein [Vicinamibacterales bacterium]